MSVISVSSLSLLFSLAPSVTFSHFHPFITFLTTDRLGAGNDILTFICEIESDYVEAEAATDDKENVIANHTLNNVMSLRCCWI